jgi:hypothetical protein
VKKVLTGCAVGLVLLVVVVAGAFLWWQRTGGPGRLKAWGTHLQAEGSALGSSKGDVACVDESIARMGACSGTICRGAVAALFAASCLGHSERTKELCESVPDQQNVAKTDWAKQYCAGRGTPEHTCMLLMSYIWSHCRADMHRAAGPAASS